MERSSAPAGLIVVKVGGSLFDLPDLGPRLRTWLRPLQDASVLLVPGGGRTADVVRAFDCGHALGEETAHWLALRALTLNAYFLQALLPEAAIVAQPQCGKPLAILDPYPFACADEGKAGCLPHSWEVTSDAVAARVAVVARTRRLVLLKSVTIPAGMGWDEAGRCGLVDSWFARGVRQAVEPLAILAVNFRCQNGGVEIGPLDSGCSEHGGQ